MQPEQPATPPPANNYDFIVNPERPAPKPVIGGKLAKNPFILKLVFIIGGAALLMGVLAILVALFMGNKTNLADITSLAATEQEIIRVSVEGKNASDQAVKNAAMNTQLSIQSHQRAWLSFLEKRGQETTPAQLALKKNTKTDEQLDRAKQFGSFDITLIKNVRSQLEAYRTTVKNAYNHATNKTQRTMLNSQYADVELLLKQWPE